MRHYAAKPPCHDVKDDPSPRAGKVRNLPRISTMDTWRRRPAKRTRRHFGACVGSHRDRTTVLYDAIDDQAGGNEGGNPKIGRHGGDSFQRKSPSHQRKSSRLSQTQYSEPRHKHDEINASATHDQEPQDGGQQASCKQCRYRGHYCAHSKVANENGKDVGSQTEIESLAK